MKNRLWLWLSIVWETHKLTRYQSKEFSCYILKSKQTQKHIRVSLQLARADLIIHSQRENEVLFSTLKKPTFSVSSEHKNTYKRPGSYSLPYSPPYPLLYSLPSLWKICKRISQLSPFDHATWQHPCGSPREVRGSARIYDVRMAQFVLKIEKLSHIIGARGSQDLRSPSPIMAPARNLLY